MKSAIIWICAVASLCGSIEANVLRHDGSRKAQVVDSVTNNVADDDTENNINNNSYDDSKEELEPNTESSFGETGTGGLKERSELTPKPSINLQRSTTSRSVIPEHLMAEIQKKDPTARPPYSLSIKKSESTPKPSANLQRSTTRRSVNLQRSTPRRSVNLQRSTTTHPVIPEYLLAEIQNRAFRKSVTTPEPTPETTTEYKYKDLVEAYTVPQPKYVPMRHASGTHYVKVDRGQDEYERVIEDYNQLFNQRSRSYPTEPDYSAPPKI